MATGRPAVKTPELELKRLEHIYGFRNRQDVISFIRERPHLVPLLLEAKTRIDKHFGKGVSVFLEVFVDPEDFPALPVLYACIQISLLPEEARQRLNRLDYAWWLDASGKARGQLCITVDLV